MKLNKESGRASRAGHAGRAGLAGPGYTEMTAKKHPDEYSIHQ